MAFPSGRWRNWTGFTPPPRLNWTVEAAKARRTRLSAAIDYLERLVGDAPEVTGTSTWTPAGRRIQRARSTVRRLKFQRAMLSTFITELEGVGRATPAHAGQQGAAAATAPRGMADYDQ